MASITALGEVKTPQLLLEIVMASLTRSHLNWLQSKNRVVLLLGLLLVITSPATAEDWMYRRSYHSHTLPPGVAPQHPIPESRSAYRPAYYNERPGFAFSSSFRFDTNILRVGPRTNRAYHVEGWTSFGPTP